MDRHFSPDWYAYFATGTDAFACFFVGLDGRILTWNPGAAALFGYTADEAVGQDAAVLWTPEDRAAGADRREMEMAAVAGHAPDVRWHLRADGSRVFVDGVLEAVRAPDGRHVGYVKVGRDGTAGQRVLDGLRATEGDLHARLEAAQVEVVRLADALADAVTGEQRRIAAVLHDDLQQLLVGAGMRVQAIRTRSVDGVSADADALARILTDAVETTRTLTARLVPPDVVGAPLPRSLGWLAENVLDVHGLRVTLDLAGVDGADGEAVAGAVRLLVFQAVRELLLNVVKHAGVAEATVTARSTGRAVAIVVEDAGVGVPDGAVGGAASGYGLAEVRRRLAAIGGSLSVRRGARGGTRTVVRAPHGPLDGVAGPEGPGA